MPKGRHYRTNTREKLIEKLGKYCSYCDKNLIKPDIHIDHILPLNRGGGNNIENLTLCCIRCNSLKGTMLNNEFLDNVRTRIKHHKIELEYFSKIAKNLENKTIPPIPRIWP